MTDEQTQNTPPASPDPTEPQHEITEIERHNKSVFDESMTFDDLGLRDDVLQGIKDHGFEKPTDIQAGLIPLALLGDDVMGQARTGTGKTAAFGLPILHRIAEDIDKVAAEGGEAGGMQALVLAPTRELAVQLEVELKELGKHTKVKTVNIIGGESMKKQVDRVDGGAHIMVGTPGRVMDLWGRKIIHFQNLRYVVLDEVDRMFDIGFREDIRKILSTVEKDLKQVGRDPKDKQTIFVSATIEEDVERLARRFMRDGAEKLTTVSGSLTVSMVEQHYISVEPWDKRTLLLHILRCEAPAATIVFCRTKMTVRKVRKYLQDKGIDAREIHGDLHQSKRNKVMLALREERLSVLVATDLAARGLDVDHITHVVNYDIPEDPDTYIHRVGRTARAGRKGVAWSFICPDEGQRLTDIEILAGVIIEQKKYPDFQPGPVPDDVREERDREAKRVAKSNQGPGERKTTGHHDFEGMTEEQIKAMFPDGKIPTGKPKVSLSSRFRTKRGKR